MTSSSPHGTTAFHWGAFTADPAGNLVPLEGDPDPAFLRAGIDRYVHTPSRVTRPHARAGWLRAKRAGKAPSRAGYLGGDEMVALDWDEAEDLLAGELRRVIDLHGNEAIFGGSYGWASAGRFHHAQSQLHRFLNTIGGFVSHRGSYSLAAVEHILPYVIGLTWREFTSEQTCWTSIAADTDLFVSFGGLWRKNAQLSPGMAGTHWMRDALRRVVARGGKIITIAPVDPGGSLGVASEHIFIRPGTDVALMLALAHQILESGTEDTEFLASYCEGAGAFCDYVTGRTDGTAKTPNWAAEITGVPADVTRDLARRMTRGRTFVNATWSIQRTEHGEQPIWGAIALASLIGQVGLSGGGFGIGYSSVNQIGSPARNLSAAALPQGQNAVSAHIPVARFSDMLLSPGAPYDYDGARRNYPDIRFVYWAGGNPFHHAQDLNKLRRAFSRIDTLAVHEISWTATAAVADIVLPVKAPQERRDFACATREDVVAPMRPLADAPAGVRTDFEIFAGLADRLGCRNAFDEGRSEEDWLRHLWAQTQAAGDGASLGLPEFAEFMDDTGLRLPREDRPRVLLSSFRADPGTHPLPTPSGKIELYSGRIAGFDYEDCPPHPTWMPPCEWLGAATAGDTAFHLISHQPETRLHSQMDKGSLSQLAKVGGREPITLNQLDAARLGVDAGDTVLVANDRGAFLAGAVISDDVMPGVAAMATGAWYDPEDPEAAAPLERAGNPNAVTQDRGTSKLAQGSVAMSCLVWIERHDPAVGDIPTKERKNGRQD